MRRMYVSMYYGARRSGFFFFELERVIRPGISLYEYIYIHTYIHTYLLHIFVYVSMDGLDTSLLFNIKIYLHPH